MKNAFSKAAMMAICDDLGFIGMCENEKGTVP